MQQTELKRTAVTWHCRSAGSLKEAMELFWPWLQRVSQLRSFPSRSHLQGCPNVPQGTRGTNNCPFPASRFFHNFSRTAIHFTRASTQRKKFKVRNVHWKKFWSEWRCLRHHEHAMVWHACSVSDWTGSLTLLPSGGFSGCAGCKYEIRLVSIRNVTSRIVLSLWSAVLLIRASDCDNNRASPWQCWQWQQSRCVQHWQLTSAPTRYF